MSSYRYDVTAVTPSDHSGHDHSPGASCCTSRPIVISIPSTAIPMSNSFAFVTNASDLQTIDLGVNDEIVIPAMSSVYYEQGNDDEIAEIEEIESDNEEEEDLEDQDDQVEHTDSNVVLPALTSDDSNSNFSDNNCDRSIQPSSPTSSFVLEEEIVPFSSVDNVLLHLDLPTVYGDRRPSTDVDLLMLSNSNSNSNSMLSPITDSLSSTGTLVGQQPLTNLVTSPILMDGEGPTNGTTDLIVQTNNHADFIQSSKARNSVFHIILEGVVTKIELIREKTGASVAFYIIFGTLEFNEKNVHKYLKEREEKLAGPDGKYSRFHLLFSKGRRERGRRSPQPSTSQTNHAFTNGNGSNGSENDHDYELSSRTRTRTKSGSDSEVDFAEDHLYAATLLKQKVSSPTIHDHQYNNEITAGCFKSRHSDPLLSGPGNNRAALPTTNATPNSSPLLRVNRRPPPFTTNFHRHRCLRNLVEALFEKLKGLENKTGANILSFTITYEENLITRENFQDVFQQLLGVRKSSFVSRFGNDKSLEYLITKKSTEHENSALLSMNFDLNGQGQGAPFIDVPQNEMQMPANVSTPVADIRVNGNIQAQLAPNNGPICSKCSLAIPIGCASPTEWTWLRCFNPLCFYMVHSTCLGFCVNFGSIDLRQFTFPPFYCDQHRLTNDQ